MSDTDRHPELPDDQKVIVTCGKYQSKLHKSTDCPRVYDESHVVEKTAGIYPNKDLCSFCWGDRV